MSIQSFQCAGNKRYGSVVSLESVPRHNCEATPQSASAFSCARCAPSSSAVCLGSSGRAGDIEVRILDSTGNRTSIVATSANGYRSPESFWLFVDKCRRISHTAFTISKIFALYLFIILLFGLVFVYTVPGNVAINFNVTILNTVDDYPLSVSYHKSDQLVFLRSAQTKDVIETMFDLQQGLVAHRDTGKKRCYIRSSLISEFAVEHQRIQEMLWSGALTWERPPDPIPMQVLHQRVHAEVVKSIAGEELSNFCGDYKTHWLVSYVPPTVISAGNEISASLPKPKVTVISSSFFLVKLHHSKP